MRTVVDGLAASGMALGSVVVWQMGTERIDRADLVALKLRFPRDLDASRVGAFLAGLSGLLPPWWKRWQDCPTVMFEVHANCDGLGHYLLIARRHLPILESLLRAHLEVVRFEEVEVTDPAVEIGAEYKSSNSQRTLRIDAGRLSGQILSSMWPLDGEERAVFQWMITPAAPPTPPRTAGASDRFLDGLRLSSLSPVVGNAGEVAAAKEKQKSPLFLATARIGVAAASVARSRQLLHRVESSLYSTTAPGVHLRRRVLREPVVAERIRARKAPVNVWPMQVNTTELAGLIGWPVNGSAVAGLDQSGCRPLAIPASVPSAGAVIGDGAERGSARPAAMDLESRFRHLAIDAPTGTGKTTLMANLVAHDLAQGYGIVAVDPKLDFANQIQGLVPPHRVDQVTLIDPSDETRPVGLNPLRPHGVAPELAVEHLVSIFHRIWAASWGVRSDDLWRAVLRTLIVDEDATLVDVGPMLTDAAFRRRLVRLVTDPVLVSYWRWFESLSDGEAAQVVGPVLNKWRALFGRPALRRILGQPHPSFDLTRAVNNGGIVIVALNSGTIGEDAANLLAALFLGSVWNAVQSRATQPAASRHPLMLHLDEFPRYASLPVPFDEMLAQARSYRVGITVAVQSLSQVPVDLRHSLQVGPRSRVVFQLPLAEAKLLAPEMGSGLTPDDLQGLGSFEVAARLHAAGHTQDACTLVTRPAPPPVGDPAAVRQRSRARWGADGDAVDRAINERMNPTVAPPDGTGTGPTGRKRRPT